MPEEKTTQYGAEQITVLEGLDPVRKRPGMYIGGTGKDGLHHLIKELLDNSIDEAIAGYGKIIRTILHPDNSVSIEDYGRGIPVDKHSKTGKSTLETVLTVLHAGGKFGDGGYKVSSGLHGVGASVVNALSTSLTAEVKRDGKLYTLAFERGKAKSDIQSSPIPSSDAWYTAPGNGTRIRFLADDTIFQTIEWDYDYIADRLRNNAYLTKGVTFILSDYREGYPDPLLPNQKDYTFYFEGGIASYVRHLNKSHQTITDPAFYVDKMVGECQIEVAMAYADDFAERVYAFANHVLNGGGGTHLTGFRAALTKQINAYAKANNLLREADSALSGDDMREGLTVVISVNLPDPQFEGQTKDKLNNPEMRSAVESVVSQGLEYYFNENPSAARKIIEKCLLSLRARLAARAARDTIIRKGALEGAALPGKLADCSEKDPSKCELYIVEGDSAGGCFTGDTEVALADGRALSLTKLIEEAKAGIQNYCYTVLKDGTIGIAPITAPRRTKQNAVLVQVVLDNGEVIRCTPDHRFMVRTGKYVEAKDLSEGVSLMPLYRTISTSKVPGITIDGYEMVWQHKKKRYEFTHCLADNWNLQEGRYNESAGEHRHHLDFNKRNNNPDNLIRLTKADHLELHQKHAAVTLHTPESKALARLAHQQSEYRAKMSKRMRQEKTRKMLSMQAKLQWKDPLYVRYMTEKWQEFYQTHPEYQLQNKKQLYKAQREFWSQESNREMQSVRTRAFFKEHGEKKEFLSELAKKQWENPSLLHWRQHKTHEQWTPEFRVARKEALIETYYRKTIAALRNYYDEIGVNITAYNKWRNEARDHSVLRFDSFVKRYFAGNRAEAIRAIQLHNHRVVKVEFLLEKEDVFDIEIPHTHNFALASGVFVHNSAKDGRDRKTQAILPLRGKILNVERARLDRMLSSEGIKNLIVASGVGIGDQIDYTKLRYHRIIIMTDADVDGAHIRTLLLTLFYRHFPEIIRQGHLYIAQPPLFGLSKGKEKHWAYSDQERDTILQKLMAEAKEKKPKKTEEVPTEETEEVEAAAETPKAKTGGWSIQRFKGLGEMNAVQLWETTMNPEKRILLQVTMENAERADEVFSMLMGDEVPPRKRFIQTHAKTATLDL